MTIVEGGDGRRDTDTSRVHLVDQHDDDTDPAGTIAVHDTHDATMYLALGAGLEPRCYEGIYVYEWSQLQRHRIDVLDPKNVKNVPSYT